MSLTDLPLSFWGYAMETAAFTLNRAPSKSVEATPYELWFGKKPKLSFLKVWGCDAYVKKLQPEKLEPKSEKCVCDTGKVDRELKKLREKAERLEQQLRSASGGEAEKLQKQLAAVQSELAQKDNDTYRRSKAEFT